MQKLTRRNFLFAAGVAALAGCKSTSESPASPGGTIDTHAHFYDPLRPQGVPWPPKNDAVLYRQVLPNEIEKIARPLGVVGAVVVEASPWVEDNEWVLGLAEKDPFLLGLVGHLKPGRPDFANDLNRFTSRKSFRGIRTGGWDIPLAPENTDFLRDLRLLSNRQLALDVVGGPDQLPKVARLAAALPELRIVIDHCAGVHIDGTRPDAQWSADIREAARHRNVHMKVSGLPEATGLEFKAPKDVEFYRPVLNFLFESFGEDRVIYGSNWPVSTRFADYATVLTIVRQYFETKGPAISEKYFRRNAIRVYGLQ
ncbi:MAG TPA: amidohydrolase family protein [Verrucomicrobiae bacterium]|nr:amidohydrolase family protein [Verrucomicrobiae bacterium]